MEERRPGQTAEAWPWTEESGGTHRSVSPLSVAVHGQGCILHHIVHGQILESAELRSVISSAQFEEEEQSDDNSSDDEG